MFSSYAKQQFIECGLQQQFFLTSTAFEVFHGYHALTIKIINAKFLLNFTATLGLPCWGCNIFLKHDYGVSSIVQQTKFCKKF